MNIFVLLIIIMISVGLNNIGVNSVPIKCNKGCVISGRMFEDSVIIELYNNTNILLKHEDTNLLLGRYNSVDPIIIKFSNSGYRSPATVDIICYYS